MCVCVQNIIHAVCVWSCLHAVCCEAAVAYVVDDLQAGPDLVPTKVDARAVSARRWRASLAAFEALLLSTRQPNASRVRLEHSCNYVDRARGN